VSTAPRPRLPDDLPHVWRAPELAHAHEEVTESGHAALDAQLPGGGWPVGSLVEILQDQAGAHAWQLLLPALTRMAARESGPVVLVNPPFEPFGPGLHAQGLRIERMLRVRAARPQACLWATEQALRSQDVAAVLAWLPQAKGAELRRLHLAASQHHRLLFVFRAMAALRDSSPARLRLQVEGGGALRVRIVKRRGPPLEHSIELPAHPQRLAALLQARQGKASVPLPSPTPTPTPTLPKDRSHVLDRTVAIA